MEAVMDAERVKPEVKFYVPELNTMNIIGTIVKEPRLTYSDASGKPCFRCRIVWNKRIPDGKYAWKEKPGYINCVMWSGYAETAIRRFNVGDTVLIKGELDHYEVDDRFNPGKRQERYHIVIDTIQMLKRTIRDEVQEETPVDAEITSIKAAETSETE